jgi:hypothetical protein
MDLAIARAESWRFSLEPRVRLGSGMGADILYQPRSDAVSRSCQRPLDLHRRA